jgi:GNAT superfamily N-acetyltransferase
MSDYIEGLPQVSFGEVSEEPMAWRTDSVEEDDTDEDLPASEEVIEMLGFDPDKEDWGEEAEDAEGGFKESEHPRGQPDNPGQFVEKGKTTSSSEGKKKIDLSQGYSRPEVQESIKNIFKSMPGANIEITGPKKDFEVRVKSKAGDFTGTVHVTKGQFFIGGIHIKKSEEGKGIGKQVIKDMISFARQSGMKEVALFADIKVGRYAWAKLGFDYADKNSLDFGRRWLGEFCKKRNIPYDKAKINSAKDIAEFKVEDKKIDGMDIGKAFMLSLKAEGHGSWDGVLKL